jgi:hypothetical protein
MAISSPPSPQTFGSDGADIGDQPTVLIADRLRQTRRYVKLIDLSTGVVTLLVGILGYLLAVSLIDHWVIDLSAGMRLVSLLILLVGVAAFFVWRLLPPILYSVNPVYAAQTIEQAAPSLKNSLINLVLLAGQRNGVSGVIYEGLRREAAGQLAHVPPETMVDRAPLIKAGYWLVALLALAALYKVLSPKDPVQSAARVAAPWMNIERPARVRILDVQPGDADVYRGQAIEVTARIEGLDADEAATLIYSTRDEQFIDQPIVMKPESPQRFRGTLSMGPRGIQQSLVYRIVAGDAETGEFLLRVKNAPHVDVKRIVYQFPRYTQLADRVVEGQADLSALEGTRVRIEAEANQPMNTAYLELFGGSSAAESPDAQPAQAIAMRTEGNRATGQLTLLLQPDRKTPQLVAYQIRFTTADGQRNEQPARYRIEVTPDLAPDIEWLQPRSADLELAENASATLEVRAYDPDFAVQQIQILGAVGGVNRLKEELLDQPQSGQVIRKFKLSAQQLGLTAGDTLIYWAEARDNRRSPTDTPAPNSQRTTNYRIRIVPPDPTRPTEADDGSSAEQRADDAQGENANQNTGPDGSQGESTEQPGAKESGTEGTAGEQGGERDRGSGTAAADQDGSQEAGTDSDGSQKGGGEPSDSDTKGGTEQGGTQQGDVKPEGDDEQAGDRSGRNEPRRGEQRGAEDRSDAESGTEQGGGEPQGGRQSGAGQEGTEDDRGEPGQASESSDARQGRGNRNGEAATHAEDTNVEGAPDDDSRSGQPRTDGRRERSEQATRGEAQEPDESPPVAPDGSNDSEAFERILRHLRDEQRDEASEVRGPRNADSRQDDDSARARVPADANEGKPDPPAGRDPATSAGQREPQTERSADPAAQRTANRSSERPDGGTGRGTESEPTADGSPADSSDGPSADEIRSEGQPPSETSPADQADPTSTPSPGSSDAAGQTAERPEPDSRDERSGPEGLGQPAPGGTPPAKGTGSSASREGTAAEGPTDDHPAQPSESTGDTSGSASRAPAGGQQDGVAVDEPVASDEEDAADKANLEYARQATDLALRHLKDDKQGTEIRDRLGWTKEETEAFVRRWEQMRRDARQSGARGEQARRRLSDQLRGLGLTPEAERVRGSQDRKDPQGHLRQGGSEVPIPAEYLEQYRAFLKTARPTPRPTPRPTQ